jgi:hypothetical protein
MLNYSKLVAVVGSVAFSVTPMGSHASAQSSDEGSVRVTPGWVFTPTVSVGATHDDNPVLAGRGDPSPDDVVTNVRPGVDLTFVAKHAFFGGGYRGAIQRYRVLDAYDSYDQGGYAEFRQQVSRRLSVSIRDNFSVSPTTDLLEVAGVPFTRTGTRQNDLNAGMTGTLTKTVQLTGSYQFHWVEFDTPEGLLSAPLQGGRSQGGTIAAHKAVTSRLRLGGRYGAQRAKVGPLAGARDFTIQDAEATISYRVSPSLNVDGGLGVSHLVLPGPNGARTGPAGHISLRKRTEHALFTVSAMRSFIPSYGFGGSIKNQQITASARIPFARNRAYSDTGFAWRRTDAVFQGELGLKSILLQTTVGYAFQPWLRLEGFYSGAFQDSTLAGGRVDRNRIGVQVVTARPMRLQ